MRKFKKPALALVVLFAGIQLASWAIHRPQRITESFIGHLSQERYDAADDMLSQPCVIKLAPNGGITIVDATGNTMDVQPTQLPFASGGGQADRKSDFSMTALGARTNGVLDSSAVVLYLNVDGGKISIAAVES